MLFGIVLLGVVALLVTSGRDHGGREPDRGSPPAAVTPSPPELRSETLNRQDQVSRARQRVESEVFDARPLLSQLPITRAGVRVDVGGLAPDDRTTILAVDPGTRSRAHARDALERRLRRARHRGHGYRLEWTR